MSYLLGMDRGGDPFCIHKGLVVEIREDRPASGGPVYGSRICVDARKINISAIVTPMMPAALDAVFGLGCGASPVPRPDHPAFISVPLENPAKQTLRLAVASLVKLEPIIKEGIVKGTTLYRHGKAMTNAQPVTTPLLPAALYRMMNIPDPASGKPSDFVFLPRDDRPHHPDCYAKSLILKINPHRDFNRTLIGTTLLLDPGGLPKCNSIEMTQKPLEVYRLFGLSVPREVAQYYHPKSPSLRASFSLTPTP
ncbi:MAG TPA: hypothetical protein PKX87_02085 [Alphaproteobacteria bacterium]|nr:hypothetical protein [Alphaproteobacteria bacterium]